MSKNSAKQADVQLIKKLNSDREDLVLEGLKEMRNTGKDSQLSFVFSILKNQDTPLIRNEIMGILNDLKHQHSVEIIMNTLPGMRGEKYFPELISSCWQNGLDYSAHLDFFLDILRKEEYLSAMEAFTVIETNLEHLNSENKVQIREKIDHLVKTINPEKQDLVKELQKTAER